MKVYLAGPISLGGTCSPSEVAAFTAVFTDWAARLRANGLDVLCPTELSRRDSWLDYMRATIPMVCEADEVMALPRWQESRGARIEVGLAQALGIPVGDAEGAPLRVPPEPCRLDRALLNRDEHTR